MNSDALNALDQAVAIARERAGDRVAVVGVAGPQGSGKTTLVKAYAAFHPRTAHFSLDDVYLPSSLRRLIAQSVHPLFATRGPPGTHNVMQLNETIEELVAAGDGVQTVLPAFDKVTDNPMHASHRPVFDGKPSVILVDGWCLGATAQTDDELVCPVNVLESERDKDAIWRKEVNANLAGAYQLSFDMLDAIVSLQAPSFAIIQEWRCEQEEGLLGRDLTDADRARVARFIQHFERITRHMMAGGRRADIDVQLDERRNVKEIKRQ
jgi:D-glycerate 3-kinase